MRAQVEEDVLIELSRLVARTEERIQARNEGLDDPTRLGATERQIHCFICAFCAAFVFFAVLV